MQHVTGPRFHRGIEFVTSNKQATLILTWVKAKYIYNASRTQLVETFSNSVKIDFVKRNMSWEKVSQLCKEGNCLLPYFTNKNHLDGFLAFLLLDSTFRKGNMRHVYFQIFVGLRSSPNKVSKQFSFE